MSNRTNNCRNEGNYEANSNSPEYSSHLYAHPVIEMASSVSIV